MIPSCLRDDLTYAWRVRKHLDAMEDYLEYTSASDQSDYDSDQSDSDTAATASHGAASPGVNR